MIYPVKWLKAILQSKIFNWVKWKLVLEFIITVIIPLFYFINIQVILNNSNTVNSGINLKILGTIIAFIGLIFWLTSMFNLRKAFGVLPKKQKRIKTGLYKYFNHPMYIGIWLTFVGLSFASSSWQGLVFTNLVMTPLLFVRAYFEDKNLND